MSENTFFLVFALLLVWWSARLRVRTGKWRVFKEQFTLWPRRISRSMEGKECQHKRTWFDRSIGLRADGTEGMATICSDCGEEA